LGSGRIAAVFRWHEFARSASTIDRTPFAKPESGKIALLEEPNAQEGALDEAIRRRGGDPDGAGQKALDPQSVAALLRGAVADPEPTFGLLRVLMQLHDELGPERVREEVKHAIAGLPKGERAGAEKRMAAVVKALKAWRTLYQAEAKV